jgi:hypothetical protein
MNIPLKRVGIAAQSRASIPGCNRSLLTSEHYVLSLQAETGLVRIESKTKKHEPHLVHVSRFEYVDPEDPPAPAPVKAGGK